jgi:hypothetical protein
MNPSLAIITSGLAMAVRVCASDRPWMITVPPDARAAIVPDYRESLEAQRAHDFHLVQRHRALRLIDMIVAVRRFAAVAVASEVGHDHGESLCQPRRDLVPHHVGLRIAVQEQEWWTAAAANGVNRRTGCLDFLGRETREEPATAPRPVRRPSARLKRRWWS